MFEIVIFFCILFLTEIVFMPNQSCEASPEMNNINVLSSLLVRLKNEGMVTECLKTSLCGWGWYRGFGISKELGVNGEKAPLEHGGFFEIRKEGFESNLYFMHLYFEELKALYNNNPTY